MNREDREPFIRPAAVPAPEAKERYFTPVTPPSEVEAERSKDAERPREPAAPTVIAKMEDKAEPVQRAEVAETAKLQPEAPKPTANEADVAKAETIASAPESKSAEEESTRRLIAQSSAPAEQKALAPPDRSRIAASIDAQLAELLGDDLIAVHASQERKPTVGAQPIEVHSEPAAPRHTEKPARAEDEPSPTSERAAQLRRAENIQDTAADPFAFDLGPSPFARSTLAAPAQPQMNGSSAPRPQETRAREQTDEPHKYVDRNPYKLNGSHSPAAAAPRSSGFMNSDAPQPVPPSQRQLAPFAVPSVSATLGPQRRLEPLSNAFQTKAPREDAPPRGTEVSRATYGPTREEDRNADSEPRRDSMLATSSKAEPPAERTMEDAMADLLRPLLKTWLAENMPKIVERALRREMSERLLPGRDNSDN